VKTRTPEKTPAAPAAVNGIDVAALRETVRAIEAAPALGMTRWSVRSRWMGGTRTDHEVRTATIGDAQVARGFTLHVDEPLELCGTNLHPNPQEVLMSALNACMMVGYSAVSALMGIRLTRLEIDLEGDIDLRGFLGIDPAVKPGYDHLRQTVRIAADASPEAIERVHAVVKATSPNWFSLTTAIPVRSTLVVE
jgi:uncharacterized OsmC-like protein